MHELFTLASKQEANFRILNGVNVFRVSGLDKSFKDIAGFVSSHSIQCLACWTIPSAVGAERGKGREIDSSDKISLFLGSLK